MASDIPDYNIVRPFDPTKIDCNAYTLSMGEEYFVTPESGKSLRKTKKRSLRPHASFTDPVNAIRGRGESFVIPPGQFAFLLTEESVRIPSHLMGFISLKSRIKFRGLINVSGFHVDPGFEGHLVYSVYNAGPSSLHIARGDPLFLLWLSKLEGEVDTDYSYGPKFPQSEISNKLVSEMAREVQSVDNLAKHVQRLEGRLNFTWFLATAITTALILLFTIIAAAPDAALENILNFFRNDT
ncbi:hypothetical protein [Erythrobacter sp. HI0028]|uniref:dCTP deaminase domain-containing protein n=1 Tax=Erythrobacter sp. HI0028 TaxID=1822227 RepID=UPI001F23FCF1|nr:hypothetical protein [Erythrobacter sp. HI0028]